MTKQVTNKDRAEWITNKDRAKWARVALARFVAEIGGDIEDECTAADLIGDLMHYARMQGWDPIKVVEHGVGMWSAEDRNPDPYRHDIAHIEIRKDDDVPAPASDLPTTSR